MNLLMCISKILVYVYKKLCVSEPVYLFWKLGLGSLEKIISVSLEMGKEEKGGHLGKKWKAQTLVQIVSL